MREDMYPVLLVYQAVSRSWGGVLQPATVATGFLTAFAGQFGCDEKRRVIPSLGKAGPSDLIRSQSPKCRLRCLSLSNVSSTKAAQEACPATFRCGEISVN